MMMILSMWSLLVACVLVDAVNAKSFTVYSQPIEIRYGEVYNKMQDDGPWDDHKLPEEVVQRYASGKQAMAVTGFTLDMVRKTANGTETPVLLSDHYLHHYILYFGTSQSMQALAKSAREDKHMKHMLTSCHGMNGGGLRMWQQHMLAKGADPEHINGVHFGSAAGAEYRHNIQAFKAPYRFLVHKPEVWMPTFHIINTQDDPRGVSPLLECPCTPQRRIDPASGTIDGHRPDPPFGCSPEFAATGNPACSLSTYVGGWRCCEHEMFLIDTETECQDPRCTKKPKDRVFMKFTFEYEDENQDTLSLEGAQCCDVTGSSSSGDSNIEHDVPACPAGTPPEKCIYVAESVMPVAYYSSGPNGTHHHHHHRQKASDMVDLAFAAPHLHWAGISLELIDTATNKTICEVNRSGKGGVMYGTGSEPGNEKGYLVGLEPCIWGPGEAPRYRRDHLLRTRTVYNASTYHMGVMSLWLMQVAPSAKTFPEVVI